MIELKDQLNNNIVLKALPTRIISLVPSQTELLFYLGLEDEVVGLTKFCVHPAEARKNKKIVGGTKKLHLDRIIKLEPDLIIANKEENTEEEILNLQQRFPVYISDIKTLSDAYRMIEDIGAMTDKKKEANGLIKEIKNRFIRLIALPNLNTLYLIWYNPLMAAGRDTFIDHLMSLAGLNNATERIRYPEVTEEDPELILLSSEPFPFKEKHVIELKEKYPKAKVLLVDGELFSWYGSRLKFFPDYVKEISTWLKLLQ